MKKEVDRIEFGWMSDSVIIKVIGFGNFRNSRYLKEATLELMREKYTAITVDLAQCKSMDSTFLGVLTGLTLRMKKKANPPIALVNVNQTVRGVLTMLGVVRFFNILDEPVSFDTHFEAIEASAGNTDEAISRIRHVLEAHENLMAVNEENKDRFNLVKKALEHDLKNKLQEKQNDQSS